MSVTVFELSPNFRYKGKTNTCLEIPSSVGYVSAIFQRKKLRVVSFQKEIRFLRASARNSAHLKWDFFPCTSAFVDGADIANSGFQNEAYKTERVFSTYIQVARKIRFRYKILVDEK